MHLRDYFDRVFIVNLPTRTDRRRDMTAELTRVGLDPERGKVEFFDAFRFDHDGGFPSIGARGCFHSHLAILHRARDLKLQNVLILEDDLGFSPLLLPAQQHLLTQLRHLDWSLCYFAYTVPTTDPLSASLAESLAASETQRHPGAPPSHLLPLHSRHELLTTAFYAVNAPVFDRAIACLEAILSRPPGHPDGGPMHVDGAFNTFRRTNPDLLTLIATPALGHQRPSRSDVTPSRLDRLPIIRHLAPLARLARARFRPVRPAPTPTPTPAPLAPAGPRPPG